MRADAVLRLLKVVRRKKDASLKGSFDNRSSTILRDCTDWSALKKH